MQAFGRKQISVHVFPQMQENTILNESNRLTPIEHLHILWRSYDQRL